MTQTENIEYTDRLYMSRALQLAAHGGGDASPNPMVGAVIVHDGRIFGVGFHRRCGEGHAEVNAVASVADESLLPHSTIYVTLEPCAHYGKTPPCAKLLIDKRIPRVVIGSVDPFAKVSGRGIAMLREAGAEVKVGVLEEECRALNERFMTAHTLRRPFITLKWAESADGFISAIDSEGRPAPVRLSNALSLREVHRLRSLHDAIMAGTDTIITDNPRLDTRLWGGPSPRAVTIDRHGRIPADAAILSRPDTIVYRDPEVTLPEILTDLYSRQGVSSLLVEGGAKLLQSFINQGLYNVIRREVSTVATGAGVKAPELPQHLRADETSTLRGNRIELFRR